jgi:hypothetical protein
MKVADNSFTSVDVSVEGLMLNITRINEAGPEFPQPAFKISLSTLSTLPMCWLFY